MIDKGVLWTSAEIRMGRRDLLTDDERRALFGVPEDHAALVRLYTLLRFDLDTIRAKRGDANRLATAVQLALLRHPGFAFASGDIPAHLSPLWRRRSACPRRLSPDTAIEAFATRCLRSKATFEP